MSISFYSSVGGPELNVHNANGALLLRLLGLPLEPDGEVEAEELLGRILIAQGLLDVAVDDEQGVPAVTDGRWTNGGRHPGDVARMLGELHSIAEHAHSHHAVVWWG